MLTTISKITVKLHRAFNYLRIHQERQKFSQNKASTVHQTFRLGYDNTVYISPSARVEIGSEVTINQNNFITLKDNSVLKIGDGTYITRATISCLDEIEIGENCILGEGLKIFDHNHLHTSEPFSVSKTEFTTGKITLGNRIWTGANVTILKGVTIGDNVILGAGVLIYKDVPANSMVTLKQELRITSL